MGSHQAAHPTPPSSVKLCRVLLCRHIQGCATYMNFERVSFYFTFRAILKSCHLSCSFTAKGRNPWKKNIFFLALPKMGGEGLLFIYYYTLFNWISSNITVLYIYLATTAAIFLFSVFLFFQVSFPHSLVDPQSWWSHGDCFKVVSRLLPTTTFSCTYSNKTRLAKTTKTNQFCDDKRHHQTW